MTTFNLAKLTAINVNLKNGEITLTAKMSLSDENFEKAEKLRSYLNAKVGGVTIEIKPTQSKLDLMEATMSPGEQGSREGKTERQTPSRE